MLVFSQGMYNLRIDKDGSTTGSATRFAINRKPDEKCVLHTVPAVETRSCLLVNLLMCEGKPGKVCVILYLPLKSAVNLESQTCTFAIKFAMKLNFNVNYYSFCLFTNKFAIRTQNVHAMMMLSLYLYTRVYAQRDWFVYKQYDGDLLTQWQKNFTQSHSIH